MTEYCYRHGVCDGTPGRGSAILPTDALEEGTSRATGAWRCTRFGCWVLSDFLSSGVWAHLRHWQGRGA